MSPTCQIFKKQSDGSLQLIETATDVETAKARVRELAAFSPGEYTIADQQTGERISIKSVAKVAKRIVFQIGYDEKDLNARAELFRRVGHEVTSVADNEAAKRALTSIQNVDVFVVGHTAPEETRTEMVAWLKANFPKVKVVALIPSANQQLQHADFNVVLNDLDEWLSLLAAATS
jgi:5'(3')-deoxyribonucleotidase